MAETLNGDPQWQWGVRHDFAYSFPGEADMAINWYPSESYARHASTEYQPGSVSLVRRRVGPIETVSPQ